MYQALNKPSTDSVSGSEFSATSYQTSHTDTSDYNMSKEASVNPVNQNFQQYYNYYSQQPLYYKPESESESESEEEDEDEEDSDDSEGSEESEEDSEESEDDSQEDVYAQWREYYNNMYRSSMYGMNPYMMQMMNQMNQMSPQMNQMNQMNPMMQMNPQMMQMNQMNPQMMQMMMMNPQMQQMMMNNPSMPGQFMNNTLDPSMNNTLNPSVNNTNAMNNTLDPSMNNANAMNNTTMNNTNAMNNTAMNITPNSINETDNNVTPAKKEVSPMTLENSHNDTPTEEKKEAEISRTLTKLNLNSELVKNSRKSTIKSNRYPSVPSSIMKEKKVEDSKRVTSLGSNFKVETEASSSDDALVQDTGMESVAFGLLNLNVDTCQDADSTLIEESKKQSPSKESTKPKPLSQQPAPSDLSSLNPAQQIDRSGSTSSNASYNSIASGSSSKFQVSHKSTPSVESSNVLNAQPSTPKKQIKLNSPKTPTSATLEVDPDETVVIKESKKKKKTKKSKPKTVVPPSPHNSNYSTFSTPTEYSNPSTYSNFSIPLDMQSMASFAPESNRQSMIDSPRHSMMMNMNPMLLSPQMSPQMNMGMHGMGMGNMQQMNYMNRQSFPPQNHVKQAPMNPEISKKINDFKELRKVIASGNKSYEYRIKWVRMLISATNNKLFTFINIKGEPIHASEAASNKVFFVKAVTQHIGKLIRDLDSPHKVTEDIKSEIALIYGNLLSYHYMNYGQSFNFEKNLDEAIRYYEMAIEFNNSNAKAFYNLGDIYEFEVVNQFETALGYYKQSAKLGYNKAIYKMALLYLNVPQVRSVKFIKILKDLSNIDLEKSELIDEDKEELQEVIGLSFYELGKIFEGIYPGDLRIDDEFIVKCLEIVPVNYGKALTYYNKSAKLNCLLAQVKLGKVYEFGELNREKNCNKSIQWNLKAVQSPLSFKRHPDAMIALSRWYLTGTNGESKYIPHPNPERAYKWCDRAIREFKTPESFYRMGQLAEAGLGDKPANYWFQKAAELNHPLAISKLQA